MSILNQFVSIIHKRHYVPIYVGVLALIIIGIVAVAFTNSTSLLLEHSPEIVGDSAKHASRDLLGMNVQWVDNGTGLIIPQNQLFDGSFDGTDFWVVDGVADGWAPIHQSSELIYSLIPEASNTSFQRIEKFIESSQQFGVYQKIHLDKGVYDFEVQLGSNNPRDIALRVVDASSGNVAHEQIVYIAHPQKTIDVVSPSIRIDSSGEYEVVISTVQKGVMEIFKASFTKSEQTDSSNPVISDVFSRSKPTSFRFPGGSLSDGYDWSQAVGPMNDRVGQVTYYNSFFDSTFGTDEFLSFLKRADAQGVITTNFGSGSPDLAARWVDYVKRSGDLDRIPYWEIGNEIYGDWERGSTSVRDYSVRSLEFIKQMRHVDDSIQIGVPVIVDIQRRGDHDEVDPWTPVVLDVLRDKIDFVSIHHYISGNDTHAALLAGLVQSKLFYEFVRGESEQFAREIHELKEYMKTHRHDDLPILITEYGFDYGPDRVQDESFANAGSAYIVYNLVRTFLDLDIPLAQYWTLANDGHFGAYSIDRDGFQIRPAGQILELFSRYWLSNYIPQSENPEGIDEILLVQDDLFSYFIANTSGEDIALEIDSNQLGIQSGRATVETLEFSSLRAGQGELQVSNTPLGSEVRVEVPAYSFSVITNIEL